MNSRFLISAVSSGSGKTTLTLGLLRALKRRQLCVQPYKCGPDYIDTKYHDLAASNNSINLDLFLSSENHVKDIFTSYGYDKDVCVVEGVMGLFDGYDRMTGSSANIAEILDIPVVLVINAKSMAYSAAPILYGFKNFYKGVKIVGAIFNFVASESHYAFLKDACNDVGIEPLGYLPKNAEVEIPSRHLGLNIDQQFIFDDFADKVSDLVEKYIDINKLLEITNSDILKYTDQKVQKSSHCPIKIAVAKDEAFNFVYHQNIKRLQELGEIVYFSPIHDKLLPVADFIYLPGGYPELYLEQLSANNKMLSEIKSFADNGGKILAECGGMMYLCKSIVSKDGVDYPMVGIFDQKATMKNMKLKLGYRSFEYAGVKVKGHEFHYSKIDDAENMLSLLSQASIYTAKGTLTDTKLFRYRNVIAGYTHIYWGEIDLLSLFD